VKKLIQSAEGENLCNLDSQTGQTKTNIYGNNLQVALNFCFDWWTDTLFLLFFIGLKLMNQNGYLP
jgi:hypothetical protein